MKQAAETGLTFLRRQEMEAEDAIVVAEDVHPMRILLVSHAWESMGHPDPRRYQLQMIADTLRTEAGANGPYGAIFYDFCSLYRYGDRDQRQSDLFQKSLQGMHLMYSTHQVTTLRIEDIEKWPSSSLGEEVSVWCDTAHAIVPKKLENLTAKRGPGGQLQHRQNETAYLVRGWCVAERFWVSSKRRHEYDYGPKLNSGVLTPSDFEDLVQQGQLVFTNSGD